VLQQAYVEQVKFPALPRATERIRRRRLFAQYRTKEDQWARESLEKMRAVGGILLVVMVTQFTL